MNLSENTKRFLYNGALLSAVGIAMRTVALFFNAFITRHVGAEGVGLYTIVMTVYNFAVTFATSGISLTVTRLVAAAKGEGRDDEVGRILTGSVLYALAFSLTASLVLFFGASYFAESVLSDMRTALSLRILAPSLVPLALISVFSGYFVGIRRVSRNAATQVAGQLFKIGVTIFLIGFITGSDVEYSSMALSLGTTLTEILCFIVIFIEFLIDRRRAKSAKGIELKAVSATALPIAFSAYIRSLLLTLEHILIPKQLRKYGDSPSESLAAYGTLHGMALPLVLYPMATLTSFSGLLVPEFAERDAAGNEAGMRRVAERSFGITLVYAILTSALLFIFSEELGYVIYNSYSAGIYIAVLAPVVPIMYLDHLTDNILKGIGEQVFSMWVNISDSLLSIALVYFLIPRMGIMGYAVAIVLMEGYNFLLSLMRMRRKIRFTLSPMLSIVLPLISALVSGALVSLLFSNPGSDGTALWLILKLIFAICIFFAIYRALSLLYDNIKTQRKAECK